MNVTIEKILYFDPLQKPALYLCPRCGGEVYGSGGCLRCERRSHETGRTE